LTGPRKTGFTSIPRFWVAALVCRNRQFGHDVTEQIDTTTHEEDAKNRIVARLQEYST
jgi:DNA polymerase III gamma/tau subunit